MLKLKKVFCCVALANSLVAESISVSRAQCFTSFVANLISKKTKKNTNPKKYSYIESGFLSSIAKKFFSKKSKDDQVMVIPKISFLGFTVNILRKKYQWFNGPCWAFALIASLETTLLKNNEFKGSLSEKHLLNWANRAKSEKGWHLKINDGANFEVAKGYLMSGAGPVYEKDKKYIFSNDTFSLEDRKMTPVCSVKGIKEIDENVDSLKNAISEYGAVFARYEIDKNGNRHAVSLIGWNESKKVFLVKDSSDNSKDYYKELPYSTKLSGCSAFCDIRNYNEKEKVYQHDFYGINDVYFSKNGIPLTVCNVYDFKGDETLKEITLATHAKGCTYEIFYTSSFKDGKPSNDVNNWKKLKTGSVPYNGYFTTELENKLDLKNEKAAIIVKIEKNENAENVDESPCIYATKSNETLTLEENYGSCYMLENEEFSDIKNIYSKKNKENPGIFSIKAVTESIN